MADKTKPATGTEHEPKMQRQVSELREALAAAQSAAPAARAAVSDPVAAA